LFSDAFSFYTKRAQTFLGKGPQKLLWAGSRATLKITINSICKGTAIPVQAWTGPKGFRRLRLPDFKTIVT